MEQKKENFSMPLNNRFGILATDEGDADTADQHENNKTCGNPLRDIHIGTPEGWGLDATRETRKKTND